MDDRSCFSRFPATFEPRLCLGTHSREMNDDNDWRLSGLARIDSDLQDADAVLDMSFHETRLPKHISTATSMLPATLDLNAVDRIQAEVSTFESEPAVNVATSAIIAAASTTVKAASSRRYKLRSPVWLHFEMVSVQNGVATTTCKHCHEVLAYHSSTTSMDRHLLIKHRLDIRGQRSSSSSSSPALLVAQEAYAETILVTQEEHAVTILDESSSQRIDVVHNAVPIFRKQPFFLLTDPSLQELIRDFDKSYEVMSTPTLAARLKHHYEHERELLKASLKSSEFVSLTVEHWTSAAGDPFAEITVHFSCGPDIVARTLACSLIPYPSNKEVLAELLFEAMDEFNLSHKVLSISVDGTWESMQAALPLVQLKVDACLTHANAQKRPILFILCLGHAINSIVQSAISSVRNVVEALAKLRSWVAFFGTHPKQLQALYEAQGLFTRPNCALFADSSMHWTSTFAMLESTENLIDGFDTYLAILESHANEPGNTDARRMYNKIAFSRLTTLERLLIRELKLLLDPFEQAVNIMSASSYCATSMVKPVISITKSRLQALGMLMKHPASQVLHARLSTIASQRFCDTDHDLDFQIAVALDPDLCHHVEQPAIDYLKDFLIQEGQTDATVKHPQCKGVITVVAESAFVRFDFRQALLSNVSNTATVADEYTQFQQTPKQYAKSPLAYWYENRGVFPLLYSIAVRCFVMQATAIPCHRLFRACVEVNYTRKRASLCAANVEAVIFMRSACCAKSHSGLMNVADDS